MSITAYPTLRMKLIMPQPLKMQFLPAIPGTNVQAAIEAAENATEAANDAAAAAANKVDRIGDTMTGNLTISKNSPVLALNKTSAAAAVIEGTNGGLLRWFVVPGDQDVETGSDVGSNFSISRFSDTGGFLGTPITIVRSDGRILIGAASTLTLSGDPTLPLHAATKQYVDSGSGGAPTSAEYVTSSASAGLSAERVLTNTATVTWDFTTPGQAKASTAAGGGNVSNVGAPISGQFARWTTATTIEGISPTAARTAIGARELVTAHRDYFVATTGNDSNDGLTVGTPFLTLQHAYDIVAGLDAGGQTITINIANGTYVGVTCTRSWIGGGQVEFVGASAAGVTITAGPAGACFVILGSALTGAFVLRTLTLTPGASLHGVFNTAAGTVYIGGVTFGTLNTGLICAAVGSRIVVDQACTISGAAFVFAFSDVQGQIEVPAPFTITGTPFIQYFINATNGSVQLWSSSITGAVAGGSTGGLINTMALVNTSGRPLTLFPPSPPAVTAPGVIF